MVPRAAYAVYAAQIRAEYAHLAHADYCRGRAAVLRRFLERPRLYFTAAAHDAWEARARANLAREIADLDAAASA